MYGDERRELQAYLKNKRIAAIDYGSKRVGWAVCDAFHISISPKGFFLRQDDDFWPKLLMALNNERIEYVLVGVPLRVDEVESKMVLSAREFITDLAAKSMLPVREVDEAFSSKRAVQTMVAIGVKKKDRRSKGRSDEIAAALLLQDFLRELE